MIPDIICLSEYYNRYTYFNYKYLFVRLVIHLIFIDL